jgi:UDPglucose 6-dehydrogenase
MKNIAVVGIGKLGICFALNLEKAGFTVIGIDIDEDYVTGINSKKITSQEPDLQFYLSNCRNFSATTDISKISEQDIDLIFIMVATPSLPDGNYDHSQIERVLNQLKDLKKPDNQKHLVIGCTVMPGYCDSIKDQMLEYNYTVNYNPEFIAQGTIIKNQQYPDQLLIGESNKSAGDAIESVLKKICKNNPTTCRMDTLSAEITKLATNCFLTMKISFANSIGDLARASGADENSILNAIGADSRIGNRYLQYGFGFGGPCFPRDNRALQHFAGKSGYYLPLSNATDEANSNHLKFQLNELIKNSKDGDEIAFDGIAYKKGSDIIEESQQLKLAVELSKLNRKIIVIDNRAVLDKVYKIYGNIFTYKLKE